MMLLSTTTGASAADYTCMGTMVIWMPRYPYTSWYNVCNLTQGKMMLLSTTTGASAADYTCMGTMVI